MIVFLAALTLGVKADDSAIKFVKSADFSEERQAAAMWATVRLVGIDGGGTGSGVIISRDKGGVYILTAHHVAEGAKRFEVRTFSKASYPNPERVYKSAKVVAKSARQDLALVRLTTTDGVPGAIRVCPVKAIPDRVDFPALTVGCGEALQCQVEKLLARKSIQRPDRKDTVIAWVTASAPKAGRSGGPLIDKRGYLLGICSGAADDKGYYCHIQEIHRFLRRNGLEHLYAEEPEK
jgi:S1-C subfamily serine protease